MTHVAPYLQRSTVRWHPLDAVMWAIASLVAGSVVGMLSGNAWLLAASVVVSPCCGALLGNAWARHRWLRDRLFLGICVAVAAMSLLALCILLGSILYKGLTHLNFAFLKDVPSRKAVQAGIGPAMWGSIWVCGVCAAASLPLGVGTAIFLEEFKPKRRWARKIHGFIQLNITNLAGVPSIVYGILGLTVFVEFFGAVGNGNAPLYRLGTKDDWYYLQLPFGRGVLAGGFTLMLVVLPVVITSTQEALRAVPGSLREGALATGATKWQMVSRMTLPAAVPGIMTGSILAMSRAIGEAAPMLVIAGIVYITFTPHHLMDEFTVMPLQIYDWAGRPQSAFRDVAASGIIVLLAVLLTFNAIAVFIRQRFQKPLQ
jgi:phosphate transport system permease protein